MSNDQATANEIEASLQSLLKVLTELSRVAKELEATFRQISEQFDTEETGLTPSNGSQQAASDQKGLGDREHRKAAFKMKRPKPFRPPNTFADPDA